MSRRLVVHAQVHEDVNEIAAFIATDNVDAALRFYDAVEHTCEFLSEHPNVGTPRTAADSTMTGIRSYGVSGFRNYLIFFLPLADGAVIARVRHAARDNDRWLASEVDSPSD